MATYQNGEIKMTDAEFKKLKKDIEIKMVELDKLQSLYRHETGKEHVMPLYLSTPFDKLESMKELAQFLAELARQGIEYSVQDIGGQLIVKIIGY